MKRGTVTIGIEKLVCGNCNLSKDGRCQISGEKYSNLMLSCFLIFENFEDRGYALEKVPEIKADWRKVNKQAEHDLALFKKWETARILEEVKNERVNLCGT